jgi:hypothetical protein
MVRHHVLIGLGFKRQNFRSRAIKYLIDRKIIGSGMRPAVWSDNETMRPAVMPYSRPAIGSGPMTARPAVEPSYRSAVMPPSYSRQRAPLKFNY